MSDENAQLKPLVAKALTRSEFCSEFVGPGTRLNRYIAAGFRNCRTTAKWEVAGSYYCTRHAKQRGYQLPGLGKEGEQ